MKPRSVLVLTWWSFNDALVQTYTLPYVRMMSRVLGPQGRLYLLTLEQAQLRMPPADERQAWSRLATEHIHWLPFRYERFGLKAMLLWAFFVIRLLILCWRERIDVIHAFCTPPGGIGCILSVLTGAPLIIDSYEPHAESMVENGTWKPDSLAYRLLSIFERWQSRRARAVIATTEGMRDYALSRYGVRLNRFYVKPACVDLELFSLARRKDAKLARELGLDDRILCVYAGKLGGIYLDREIFEFWSVARQYWGERFAVLMLTNATRGQIEQRAAEVRLDASTIVSRFVKHADMPTYMGLGDFAINPVKPVPTKRYCTSIKDGEYWALGLPVLIPPNISDDSDIIARHGIGVVLEGFETAAYQRACQALDALLTAPSQRMVYEIRSVAERYRGMQRAEAIYEEIYGP